MTQALATGVVPALHAVAASNWNRMVPCMISITLHVIVDCWWVCLTARPRTAAADASRTLGGWLVLHGAWWSAPRSWLAGTHDRQPGRVLQLGDCPSAPEAVVTSKWRPIRVARPLDDSNLQSAYFGRSLCAGMQNESSTLVSLPSSLGRLLGLEATCTVAST